MNNRTFEYITNLQYALKAAEHELKLFRSGEKYVRLKASHAKMYASYESTIKKLRKELLAAQNETAQVRDMWFMIFEEMEKEFRKETERLQKELKSMKERALRAETERDSAKDKVTEQRHQLYSLQTELEEEKGKNQKLTAQLNRDYENSSIPSSMTVVKKKKISNSREKSGRKPGGQPGHEGHSRKKQEPTEPAVLLDPPQEVLDDPDFKKTSKTIVKQVVGIQMNLIVKEYHAEVYYNSRTGERVHAAFPDGITDDVSYDGSVRAFLYLLNNDCGVSIDKSRQFLSDLTGGKLRISKGMVNKLSREFAEKTLDEQNELFRKIVSSPVMHTDCTNARENGKNVYVFVCATPEGDVMYFARAKKGHEGVKGTPAEIYSGILVHDHDITFYNYGSEHQECLSHVLRYLKDSMENEPDRTWNKEMYRLIQEMIHTVKQKDDGKGCEEGQIVDFEKRYHAILKTAQEEYEYEPASKYYRDGYNLYRKLEKYMDNHLLFLHDPKVPYTNNESLCERYGYAKLLSETA